MRTSLGKSQLVNGVEAERIEMCVSWEAQPGMLHCRCQSQVAPNWVAQFPHWVSAVDLALQVSFQLLGWRGRLGLFAWFFLAGELQLS